MNQHAKTTRRTALKTVGLSIVPLTGLSSVSSASVDRLTCSNPDCPNLVSFHDTFDNGLGEWETGHVPVLDPLPDRNIPGDGEWSSEHGGSVNLHVDGSPSTIHLYREVDALKEGTEISANYAPEDYSLNNSTVKLAVATPGGDSITLERDCNQQNCGTEQDGHLWGMLESDVPAGSYVYIHLVVWPGETAIWVQDVTVDAPSVDVSLDIKPDTEQNPIDPQSERTIPVAVKQTNNFDPTERVDVDSLLFGTPHAVDSCAGAESVHTGGHIEDVDNDGDDDLLLHFPSEDADFDSDETRGKLVGKTNDGMDLVGTDNVSPTPSESVGFEDGFENGEFTDTFEIGKRQSDTSIDVTEDNPKSGDKSLMVRVGTTGQGDIVIERSFGHVRDTLRYTAWIYPNSKNHNIHFNFKGDDGSAGISFNAAQHIIYRTDRDINAENRDRFGNPILAENPDVDMWYRTSITAYPSQERVDFEVTDANGNKWSENSVPATTDFEKVRIGGTDYHGNYTFYVDDVRLEATSPTDTDEWSMTGHDRQRTFSNLHTNDPQPPLTERWSLEFDGAGASGPAVVGDTAYIGSIGGSGNVWALSVSSGDEQWSRQLSSAGMPTVVNGTVYAGWAGDLYALDPANGETMWQQDISEPVRLERANVGDGKIFAQSQTAGVAAALAADDGTEVWRQTFDSDATSVSAIVDGAVFVNAIQNDDEGQPKSSTLYALRTSDGEVQWKQSLDRGFSHGVTAVGGRVLVPSNKPGLVQAFDVSTGDRLWEYDPSSEWISGVATTPETAYVTTNDPPRAFEIDVESGTVGWTFEPTAYISGPGISSDAVYVAVGGLDATATVVSLTRSGGDRRWEYEIDKTGHYSPLITKNTVFIDGVQPDPRVAYVIALGEE